MNKHVQLVLAALIVVALAIGLWLFLTQVAPSESQPSEPSTGLPSVPRAPSGGVSGRPNSDTHTTPSSESESGVSTYIPSWYTPSVRNTGISSMAPPSGSVQSGVETTEALERVIAEFSDTIKPGTAVFASNFALQRWGDENSAGVALLAYVNGRWEVVDMGGGAPGAEWLLSLGVPSGAVQELLAKAGF